MALKKGVLIFLLCTVSSIAYSQMLDEKMSTGVKQYQIGKYIDCIYYMNLVLEERSELYSEALFWKAKSQYELGHFNDSKTTLETLFRKGSIVTAYYEDARFLYCKVFFKLNKFEDAILLFRQFKRNESFTFYRDITLFWLGESYLQLSELSRARDFFKDYLEIKPGSKLAKRRVDLIDRMLSLISAKDSTPLTPVDKAGWLTEFVIKELKENRLESDDKTITELLDNFQTKEQFFYYLNSKFLKNKPKVDQPVVEEVKEEAIITDVVDIEEDSDTINEEEYKKRLNELENKILEELEKKLKTVIGEDS